MLYRAQELAKERLSCVNTSLEFAGTFGSVRLEGESPRRRTPCEIQPNGTVGRVNLYDPSFIHFFSFFITSRSEVRESTMQSRDVKLRSFSFEVEAEILEGSSSEG